MPGYRYRITVEPLTDRKGEPVDKAPVIFEVENHDEILGIIERLQAREDLNFGKDKTAAFAVGLKLFSETMMENRKHPLFAPLRTAFMEFMTLLKKGSPRDRHQDSEQ
ncbi:DUF3861 domain-containing protein [Yersinia mollaretii]|uniref:Domain of Uncharacterized Function with PDB structure n=1 Tax=Yersinia mollaretii TaxID=33060 RepID=A0AA36PL43_YERMO|nr:DUF3861 domain-containing protein [Yersinia mollaretii]MDA5527260.1 DUF3861 domain-containing protein [Yersinia mollaretii]MDA5533599.1 DUF3861 domain-containing protein [Yersinia mollaretii]MDR7874500.1 DUF3861 domain-containing protein [Yersinia mollaretii]NIL01531.1 DUF3861 domain-containing protein [Yersinia mollaretii]WQC74104.1 DUF3861 domain-containing protein [Yersinia mollaretii]